MSTTIDCGSRNVELKKPDKELFPEAGLSKKDLVDHLRAVAEHMLPFLKERPLTVVRAPDGIDSTQFVQKRVPDHAPDWLERTSVDSGDGPLEMPIAADVAHLVWLAGQGSVEFHPWLSRIDRPHHPDRFVMDLDPSGDDDAAAVREAALLVGEWLSARDVTACPMLTGGSGIHIVIGLNRKDDIDQVRRNGREWARVLAEEHPNLLTVEQRKNKRGDRIYLDVARNAYAQTAIAPYSTRARRGAPVATPITWDELRRQDVHPRKYDCAAVKRRLAQRDCPLRASLRHRYASRAFLP